MIQSPFQRAINFLMMFVFSVAIMYYGARGVFTTFQAAASPKTTNTNPAVLFGIAALFGLMFLVGILMTFKVARAFLRDEDLK